MNTTVFVFGQLLDLETLWSARREEQRFMQTTRLRPAQPQGEHMDNSLLIIAFLIVGLIANFTVLAAADE